MFGGILNSTSSFSEEKEEEFEEQKIKLDLVAVHGWPHELHIDEDGVSMPHVLGNTSVQKLEVEESQLEADTGHQHHQPDVDGLLGHGSWGQQGREYVVQCHNHHCAGARVVRRKSPGDGPQCSQQDEAGEAVTTHETAGQSSHAPCPSLKRSLEQPGIS